MKPFSLRMPLRFLRGSYSRLALTVVALACGVALVCAIDLVNRAVFNAFAEIVDTMAGRAALQVSTGEGGLFPEELAADIAGVPGVELAVPVVSATTFVADGSGEQLTVHGVDITNDDAVRVYETRDAGGLELEDPLVFLSQPDSVVLTHSFAQRRSLAVGSQIALETPTGRRRFTVRGLLEPKGIGRIYGGGLAVMDLLAAEAAFARAGFINRVDVVIEREEDVARVQRDIAAALPAGLRVETPAQRKANLHAVMRSLQVFLQGVGLIGLVAAFLIAFNRLTAVFEGRAWQVGILRAVGVPAPIVWRELLKESLVLGVAGVIVGIPLGIGLGRLLLPVVATTTALNFKLVPTEPRFVIGPLSLALAAALGLGAALLAAALPARRAARMAVAEVLQGRGVEQRSPGTAFWMSLAVIATGAALAIVLQSLTGSAVWGLVATVLIAVGTALASRPLVLTLGVRLLPMFRSFVGPVTRFAVATVTRKPRRSALTIAVLGVGVGSVIWLWIIGNSFERSLLNVLTPALRADLVVGSAHIESGAFESPVDDTLAKKLATIPGVRAVAGERVVTWQYAEGPIIIEAFDPAYFTSGDFGPWPLFGERWPDAWDAVARGEATVVSSNFVQNLGASVGDTVTLATPSGPLTVRIAGVTMDFASPRGTLKLSRELYQRFWHDPQVTLVLIRTADVAATRAAIANTLGLEYGLRILSSGELMAYYAAQVRRAFGGLDVLAAMILLVILIGMADTLAAGVVERTRELGAIRAVGVTRRHLGRMVVVEGLLLGGLGLVLAVATGSILGVLWVTSTFPYLLGWVLELHIPYWKLLLAAGATFLVSIAAALLPARRAARLEPAAALRYE